MYETFVRATFFVLASLIACVWPASTAAMGTGGWAAQAQAGSSQGSVGQATELQSDVPENDAPENDAPEDDAPRIGDQVAAFELKDVDGKSWSWQDFADSQYVVVVFCGVECPLVKLYAARLQELHEEFESRGVQFVAINSNQHDSLQEIQAFVRRNALQFPMLKDPGNKIADAFGAERTPEVFVLDDQRRLVYHGGIDDEYTYGRQKARSINHFLRDALVELLESGVAQTPTTEFPGCYIGKKFKQPGSGEVTYSRQISRILQANCVSCHRPGEIGPFSLLEYDEVVGWAAMIREVVNERRMPPWHANPEHGEFSNDARLSEAELELINRWVEDGAPQGDPDDLPAPREFATGWQIGQPDVVYPMNAERRPYDVPARGIVPYRYFSIKTDFKEDKWIKAAEARPGNRAVVHHIIVAIGGEGNQQSIHGDLESEFITATAPGAPPLVLPEGYAKRLPAGATLVFQMHYTPNGQAQSDLSEVGLIFADPDEVRREVVTLNAVNTGFTIPAGKDNFPVNARAPRRGRFDEDLILLSLFPHMHLRGKAFRYELESPDGSREVLLDVPRYDFNWQNGYHLATPRRIEAGSRIRCYARFDNSENNLANPNPNRDVGWGDQTFDEMMIGYFDVALADQELNLTDKGQQDPPQGKKPSANR